MTGKTDSKNWIRNSITIKFVIVGILILTLLIPAGMIKSLILERNDLRNTVVNEISYKWGNPQTIAGPILTIPYKQYYKKENKIIEEIHYAHFLPEKLDIEGNLNPEIRYRGIYKVVVYNTLLNFNGTFVKPDFSEWKVPDSEVLWEDASISIRIPDMRGIKDVIRIIWNDSTYDVNPGIDYQNYTGVSARVKLNEIGSNSIHFSLNLNGSDALNFIPGR